MSTSTILLDDGVRDAEKGLPFPVHMGTAPKTVFDLSSDEFEAACKEAVAERDTGPVKDYVLRLDPKTGRLTKFYPDDRIV